MPRRRRKSAKVSSQRKPLNGAVLRIEDLEERVVPTLLGNSLFPADNPWNQNIANAPVAANSVAIMNAIIGVYSNGHFHPDFGQDTQSNNPLYGIPYNAVHGNSGRLAFARLRRGQQHRV
jgi:hypothetical protein